MNNFLKYGKISLRPLEPDDIDLIYAWENNIEIWEISNTKTPFSKHTLFQYIQDAGKDIYELKQVRLIIQSDEYKPVGALDLFDFDPFHLRACIGILVHNKSDRQKGYAIDALMAVSDYAANVLGLNQLYAHISEDNLASISLFEKAGFLKTGIKKHWLKTTDGWKDEFIFQKFL